jgi:PKD repeat protein
LKKITFYFLIIFKFLFYTEGFSQEFCDFWGTAHYLGRYVNSEDVVAAYDSEGQFLANAYVVKDGNYSIHIPGDDPSTTEKDGAIPNEFILFRINEDSAEIVDGDNRWIKGVKRCDLNVPTGPPRSKPGGPYYGSEGSEVVFDGSLSSGNTETFIWDFGDGNVGTGIYPKHTYDDEGTGTYIVSLTVSNDKGEIDTKTTEAFISNVAPLAEAGSNTSADEGESVTFHGSSFDPGILDLPFYVWDYGDGYGGTGKDISHSYGDNGTYIVKLTVEDGDGGVGEDSLTIVVFNVPPVADAGGPYYSIIGQPVHFFGSATDPGNDTFDYRWDLNGDGDYNDSFEQNPQKTYHSVGTYDVYLKVIDDDLDQDTSRAVVHIEQGIAVRFETEPKSGFQIIIDSQTYTSPATLYLMPDTLYTIEVPEYQTDIPGIRHQFDYWSDGKFRIHTIMGPTAQMTYTAYYRTQYQVDIENDSVGTNVIGEGWYYTGDRVDLGIDGSYIDAFGTTKYIFQGWMGSGKGAYTGSINPVSFYMQDEPITESIQWQVQYYLLLDSPQNRGNPKISGWYNDRSWVTFSIDTVVQVSSDERYVFDRWNSSDALGYSGEESIHGFLMLGPVTEQALWHHQYAFSALSEPSLSGSVVPSQGWGKANDSIILTAVGNIDSNSVFSYWEGDASGNENPLNLVLDEQKNVIGHFIKGQGHITIHTNPAGLQVIVSGNTYIAPVVFNWSPNATKTIAVTESQGDSSAGTVYSFDHWSDQGERIHQITVPSTPTTYTATFQTYHYLDLISDYGNPDGEGWKAKNSMVQISVDSLVEVGDQAQQRFTGWIGTGKGAVTDTDRILNISVQGPITEQAQWSPQFGICTRYSPSYISGVQINKNPSGPWYDFGAQVQVTALSMNTDYTFVGWGGDIVSTQQTIQVVVTGPMELIANFYTPQKPPVIAGMPDLTLLEDQLFEQSFTWLSTYVSDPSDPLKYLHFDFENAPHIQGVVDTLHEKFQVIPAQDWWGTEYVTMRVTDPSGLYDEDVFKVQVLSQDDPPRSFKLLSPPNNAGYSEGEYSIHFVWESSKNVDLNDLISYNFYMSTDAQFFNIVTVIEATQDTFTTIVTPIKGTYWWRVGAKDATPENDGIVNCDLDFVIHIVTDVESEENNLPKVYRLSQNYPNPFNPETMIRYQMPKPGKVRLSVYDVCGRCVRTLVEKEMHAGYHEAIWDGKDHDGKLAASGVYIFDIRVNDFVSEKKMILLR